MLVRKQNGWSCGFRQIMQEGEICQRIVMNNYKHLSNSEVIVRKLVPTKTIKKKIDAFYKLALYAFILA